jgi:hypothetical protein
MHNEKLMTENEYQTKLLELFSSDPQHACYFGKLPLRYEIGKYRQGKLLGMPDCELDIVSVDQQSNFHLWELKKLESNELNTGKFLGQLMLYDFLFSTEPWNELLGRFCTKGDSKHAQLVGDLQAINDAILANADDSNTEYADDNGYEVIGGDAICSFKSWKVVVCGGKGYELAAGYNPVIWSYWTFQEQYFNENTPPLEIYHFYETSKGFQLRELTTLSLHKPSGLCDEARQAFENDHPNWEYA